MIVQDITRDPRNPRGRANIKPLAAYMLQLHGMPARQPRNWGLGDDHENAAVAWAKSVNCVVPNLGWSIEDFDYAQQVNKRAHPNNKTYHYVISFPEGEHPSKAILEDIERMISTAIGYSEHQRLLAVHRNTPNLHMHVAVNKVHPETFRCISMGYDHFRLQRAAAEAELKYGLRQENHQSFSRTEPRRLFIPSWKEAPVQQHDPGLLEQYRLAAKAARERQAIALGVVKRAQDEAIKKQLEWYSSRWESARGAHLNRGDWLSTSQRLKQDFNSDLAMLKRKHAIEREDIRREYPLIGSFNAFKSARVGVSRQLGHEGSSHVAGYESDRTVVTA